jgi:hypothetical protein
VADAAGPALRDPARFHQDTVRATYEPGEVAVYLADERLAASAERAPPPVA